MIPGPRALAVIEKLDRRKGLRRGRPPSPESQRGCSEPEGPTKQFYRGRAFDGLWTAHPGHADCVSEWARHFSISGGHATLGDGSETQLAQLGEDGPVFLCGGQVLLRSGALFRKGKTGGIVRFVFSGQLESSSSSSSSAEDASPLSGVGRRSL